MKKRVRKKCWTSDGAVNICLFCCREEVHRSAGKRAIGGGGGKSSFEEAKFLVLFRRGGGLFMNERGKEFLKRSLLKHTGGGVDWTEFLVSRRGVRCAAKGMKKNRPTCTSDVPWENQSRKRVAETEVSDTSGSLRLFEKNSSRSR